MKSAPARWKNDVAEAIRGRAAAQTRSISAVILWLPNRPAAYPANVMARTEPSGEPRSAKPSWTESRPAWSLMAGIRYAHEPNIIPQTTNAITTAARDRPSDWVT